MPIHIPVMPAAVLEWLGVAAGQTIVDGTLGGGGHAALLAEAVGPAGRVIAVDRDAEAVARAREALAPHSVTCVHASYDELPEVLAGLQVSRVDGILLDLGLSSDQLADPQRGFGYDSDGELDMRFDTTQGVPARQLVAEWPADRLANAIYEYGEERFSRRIARRICETRRTRPIRTASDLASLVRSCVPRSRGHRIDPATRTFQALRIAVNDELGCLQRALRQFPDLLVPHGRLVAISFHSLEDRIVKHAFRDDPRWRILTKKPLQAAESERRGNPRSRSAKLRAAERKPE